MIVALGLYCAVIVRYINCLRRLYRSKSGRIDDMHSGHIASDLQVEQSSIFLLEHQDTRQ